MDTDMRMDPGRRRLLLLAILVLATLVRLYHFRAPLLDQLHIKQVFVANKARNIARSPSSSMGSTFDFLRADGARLRLVEEVPLYAGLVGMSYALFGEHEWLGRLGSILATLAAIAALHDWVRREFDDPTGLVAAFLFAVSPLMIFWGRAVTPDPCMLACMLLCAACYRRHLDEGDRAGWLAAAALFGLLGAAFKYYGLMVLIPLADMAYRRGGWRAWLAPRFLGLAAVMVLPIAAWLIGVFARHANPTTETLYFFFQEPGSLVHRRFFIRLTLGLLLNDLGPFTTLLMAAGAVGAALGMERARPLLGWTVMGILFVFLLAPKFLDHDYYGLLTLPAAAGWAAVGWRVARRAPIRSPGRRAWRAVLVLSLITVIHSPWVMGAKYILERHHGIVAARLNQLCTPAGKVIVLGQQLGWPAVHYSGRLGWIEQCRKLPPNWQETFGKYHALGAELVALYFDPSVPAQVRESYRPLIEALPLVEHESGPWFRHDLPCEYYIFSLREPGTGGGSPPPTAPRGRVAAAPSEPRIR
jgi:4-amino-4-deoxy-L-arabinose transferase-like glycosyltransferase